MIDRSDSFVCVGFGKRVMAALLDLAVATPLILLTPYVNAWSYGHRSIVLEIAWYVAFTAFWMAIVVRFGGTPGKLLLGMRIVDSSGDYLSWSRAFRRELFPNLLLCSLDLVVLWQVLQRFPEGAPHATLMEQGQLLLDYGGGLSSFRDKLAILGLLDIGAIAFNEKKRAIHDFIAGSFVITKESYEAVSTAMDYDPMPSGGGAGEEFAGS